MNPTHFLDESTNSEARMTRSNDSGLPRLLVGHCDGLAARALGLSSLLLIG